MVANVRSVLLAVCGLLAASPVSATPVTWQASGQISNIIDPVGALTAISIGTNWTFDITFEPDTPGVLNSICSTPTYRYTGAISEARFQLGDFTYTQGGGDIFTNADLPVFGCGGSVLGGSGLVQFQWVQGWSGGAGGPNLNLFLGLLLASYNDVNAADGSLPTVPHPSAVQSALAGLEWDSSLGGGPLHSQFTSPFNPQPVPEPASWILMGTGLTMFARRRWKHHTRGHDALKQSSASARRR